MRLLASKRTPQAGLVLLVPLGCLSKSLPGAPGTPTAGRVQRSRPHHPGTRHSCKDVTGVHEDTEEGGYAGKGSEDKSKANQGLPEDHKVGEHRSVGNHHVLQKVGVPASHLGMLTCSLGYGALCEAFYRPTGTLAYPASLSPLAPSGLKPLVTKPESQDQPHRSHPGVGEKKAGYARLGDVGFVVSCSYAHLTSVLGGRNTT